MLIESNIVREYCGENRQTIDPTFFLKKKKKNRLEKLKIFLYFHSIVLTYKNKFLFTTQKY
jgi:hypothetical protein